MYKVLILDDEPLISKGLSEKIDWAGLECEICGIASDGFEGKKMINELNPDIVVSDVVMPGHTGLELAEYVYQSQKEIIIILLSGYDEFSYAKEALKHGVFDYLLKPTNKDEVSFAIKKAVNKIEQHRVKEKNYKYLETAFQESKPIIEQSILYDVTVKGKINTHNLGERIDNIKFPHGKGAVITIQLHGDLIHKLSFKAIKNPIEKLFFNKEIQVRFITHEQQLHILPSLSLTLPNKIVEARLKEVARHILFCFSNEDRLKVSIGMGVLYTSFDGLHSSYLQSVEALSKSYFTGAGQLHIYDDQKLGQANKQLPLKSASFVERFEELELEEISNEFNSFFYELKYTFDKQLVLNYCLELLIKLGLVVSKWDKSFEMSFGYEKLEQCYTFAELRDFMYQICLEMKHHLYKTMNNNNIGVVEQAKRIIEQQYSNPDLNAQYIAEKLDVSVSYLSRTFKKETEENISNYLTKWRIHAAKMLLANTDLKANEVSKKVGFMDSRYFGQVFKKVMRTTPSAYKKIK
jgi:two-component system, response regulator YesN